ncbi:serine/threonine-protein kinase fhke-related [Anaeramoeba flamelloides]|uniref:Serine/threonine-protein kinase fhke-related n=1 Tax=Anaeramoeba flamelloides TaxID=1746091 RepID=A0AAV8A0B0_9EUKA|nr:serine/threonine-protein kinase fhke-related [Anaeramoeba flamelloides]
MSDSNENSSSSSEFITDSEQEENPWGKINLRKHTKSKTKEILLFNNELRIGRSSQCEIQIKGLENHISKVHCIITKGESKNENDPIFPVYIEDNSTNGTFVNGLLLKKGKKQELHFYDEVTFCQIRSKKSIPPIIFTFEYTSILDKVKNEEISKRFEIMKKLGKGKFGAVFLVKDREDQKLYAIKSVNTDYYQSLFESSESCRQKSFDEVNSLLSFNHPNIVKLHEVFLLKDKYILLKLDFVGGGDLFESISTQTFSEQKSRNVMKKILEALKYMHEKGYAHRDIKPENILMVTKNGNDIKLTDFGLSRAFPQDGTMMTCVGTENYIAPEVVQGNGYTKSCDLWSAGVVLYNMLSGLSPFDGNRGDMPLLQQILQGKFYFYQEEFENISNAAKNLINMLIQVNPDKRLTAEQALNHPWILGNPEEITDQFQNIDEKNN